jgi:hypothetical protein
MNKFIDTEWLAQHSEYDSMVEVMGNYDPFIDYVGPEDKLWLTKVIPRRLVLLCDINVCAFIHDYRYMVSDGDETLRLAADVEFLANMFYMVSLHDFAPFSKLKFVKAIVNFHIKRIANTHALYYYTAVRVFGKFFDAD